MDSNDGAKRAAENGELEESRAVKKPKNDSYVDELQRVAGLVLVLAAMGKMRGGGNPTAAEVEMMTEAREKLVEVCQGFAPKDLFPRESFGVVMEDLGLSKLREQRLGFRPPTMSIAEKLAVTRQKMEKSEEFAVHSAAYSSQRLQSNVGSAAESRGASHTARILSSEKQSQAPNSSGGFQPASPLGHVPTTNSTPLPYQLPSSEVRPVISGLPSSLIGKDPSSLSLPRAERPLRSDAKSNGASYAPQVQVNSSGDHTKTSTWAVHPPQSASSAKTASDNKVMIHAPVKVEGTADMSRVAPQQTTSKSFISQTATTNQPRIHQHVQQGVNFVQAPSLSNSHIEIGKIVQKLLQPQVQDLPVWTPPSRDYMNKSLACQMCKHVVNEVDNVLVCDACEKGYHLNCLQYHNTASVPRGEWHCGKCEALSNGKPLPPKYGRVMRNTTTASKLSSTATSVLLSSEKKMGALNGKVNLQRITANGNSGMQGAPTGSLENKSSHFEAGGESTDARLMQGHSNSSSKGNTVCVPSGSAPNNLIKSPAAAWVTPVELSVERSTKEELIAESKSQATEKPERVADTDNRSQAFERPQNNDQTGLQNSSKDLSGGEEIRDCNTKDGAKQVDQRVSSSDCLHDVDWIGDVLQVVDEKTYYQSCCINGVIYKVQDHALFRSKNNKLTPSKLQRMWEDSKTRSKWVVVSQCYFPADLPEGVGRPCAPEINEAKTLNLVPLADPKGGTEGIVRFRQRMTEPREM